MLLDGSDFLVLVRSQQRRRAVPAFDVVEVLAPGDDDCAGLGAGAEMMPGQHLMLEGGEEQDQRSQAGQQNIATYCSFLGSLSLLLGNPKVMIFFLSIMPLVVDVRTLSLLALAEIAAVSAAVIFSSLAAYALAANRARAFLGSTRAMKFVHRVAGGLMAGVAVAVAAR